MDDREGIGSAAVHLDPARKARATAVCSGIGIAELTIGGAQGAASVARAQALGAASYAENPQRRRKALEMASRR
jgi:hypothetical protein